MRVRFVILALLCIGLFYFAQNREFYEVGNGQVITVWKTLGNKCYIIPYKYYGILRPKEGFAQIDNNEGITLFFPSALGDTIVYMRHSEVVYSNSTKKNVYFLNYKRDEVRLANILYNPGHKNVFDLKDGVWHLDIHLR